MVEATEQLAGELDGATVIRVLEAAGPGDVAGQPGLDALLGWLDPARLGPDDVRRLLAASLRLGRFVPELDLTAVRSERLTGLLATASDEQLERVLAVPTLREKLLDVLFDRTQEHMRPARARHLNAVVRWRLPIPGQDGYDRYEVTMSEGFCVVSKRMTERPRMTVTIAPLDLLRMVSQQVTPAVLFVAGRLRVKGDLAFAAGLINFFDLPTPRAGR